MPKIDIETRIRKGDRKKLLEIWDEITNPTAKSWTKGKGFEYLICKAFELEGANVEYPYNVIVRGTISEQIDGLISFGNIYCLIECKNQTDNVDFEPISKLRSRLQRRPSAAIGAIFTTASFTEPALILNEYLHPQTILMWEKMEIFKCLEKGYFMEGLKKKYQYCIANGLTNYNLLVDLL